MAARKPDYDLSLMHKVTGRKNPSAGGAWLNDDGSINIQLNPFITFTDDPDTIITLFPRTAKSTAPPAPIPGVKRYRAGKLIADDPYSGEGPPWIHSDDQHE
jgi:hypothetical protein